MRKTQYLIIDSDFVDGTNNSFSVTFGITSNTFIQEMKDVIAIKLMDVYITQIGESDGGSGNAAKYVDIVCPEIPVAGQMLSERNGQVFARVPLERNSDGGQSYLVHDKEWKPYANDTRYFTPLSIKTLSFKLFEYQGDGDYVPLQPDAEFYMVLEITTIDHKAPPEDKTVTVIENLEKIAKKLDKITKILLLPPEPQKKKYPVKYLIGGIGVVVFILYMIKRLMTSSQTSLPLGPVPGPRLVQGQPMGQPLGQLRPGVGPGLHSRGP